jgi:hypothetical protein
LPQLMLREINAAASRAGLAARFTAGTWRT